MSPERFVAITAGYPSLRIALLGDFCLDRYLEIDPARAEVSIETGLPVHNIVRVRSQPGAAGTILNNLVALGIGEIHPIGFCGEDGEGFELRRALASLPGVQLDRFVATDQRRTFTYCKPLLMKANQPPEELNRLDSKNWSPTPAPLQERLVESVRQLADCVDAFVVMDQVERADTGVVTARIRAALDQLTRSHPRLLILADSRGGLRGFPPVGFKMNAAELGALVGVPAGLSIGEVKEAASALASRNARPVFVTLAEHGMVGAQPGRDVEQVPAQPVRGPIDIVGAGDAVTANLASALAGGSSLREAMELAMAAAHVVIHKLGTTGTASVGELHQALFADRPA